MQKHLFAPLKCIFTYKTLPCLETPGLFIPHHPPRSAQVNQFTQLARRMSHPTQARASRPTEATTCFVAPGPKKNFVVKDNESTKRNMVNTRVELAALAFPAEAISTTL
jgi:hypothetical protein